MTRVRKEIENLLPMASMLFPNPAVAEWLTGKGSARESVEALLTCGPELVGLKLREQGCPIGSADGIFGVPAFEVDPLDGTGAGDSFDAGLILGRIAGLRLRESALLANALGALATTVTGAGNALPGPQMALSFLRERDEASVWEDWREGLGPVREYLAGRQQAEIGGGAEPGRASTW